MPIPFLTAEQMAEVDRLMVEEYRISLPQMMENAGRQLADLARSRFLGGDPRRQKVVVLAGSGGNGGGGLAAARHLHNWGAAVEIILTRPLPELEEVTARQARVLTAMGVKISSAGQGQELPEADLILDALIGYSLRGSPRGRVADLIELCNQESGLTLSLDLPSGLDATTGETPGPCVDATRTLTLALPKRGLRGYAGELYLADIGIPNEVYRRMGLTFEWPGRGRYSLALRRTQPKG